MIDYIYAHNYTYNHIYFYVYSIIIYIVYMGKLIYMNHLEKWELCPRGSESAAQPILWKLDLRTIPLKENTSKISKIEPINLSNSMCTMSPNHT